MRITQKLLNTVWLDFKRTDRNFLPFHLTIHKFNFGTKRPNPFFAPVKYKPFVPLCTQTSPPLLSSYSSCLQRENKYETKPQSRMLEPHSTFCIPAPGQLLCFESLGFSLTVLNTSELVIIDCHKEKYLKKYRYYSYGSHNQGPDSLLVIRVHCGPGTTLIWATPNHHDFYVSMDAFPNHSKLLWSSWKHQPFGDVSPFTAAKENSDEYNLNMGSTEGEGEENNLYQINWQCPSRCSIWSLKAQF